MDAFTAKEYSSFHLKVLDQHLPLAMDILSDIVLHPQFDADEMAKEKKVICEEINMVEDTPDDLVIEMFSEAFWPDHPLGRPILGTKRHVTSFSRDDIETFFRKTYHAGNLIVAAAGNLTHENLRELVVRHFGALTVLSNSPNGHAPVPAARIVTRSKRELEQVHLCLGTPALPQNHPARYILYVINTILGGSMSSRLFQNVREKRGLAYAISSGVAAYQDAGQLSVYAATSLDHVEQVLDLACAEIARLRVEDVPAAELRRAQDHLKGSLMLALENTSSRMNHLARQEIYYGRLGELDEILAGIEAVTASDVRALCADLFSRELSLSLLGSLEGYRPKRAQLVIPA
jgi:predicted Zn-dependent peptidase